MAQNFLGCDRDQVFLLPPSVDDWLPADHFARFVIAAVEEFDLSAFYADYRADGHGRPAHDPAMMVALLVYAYARGKRSSRAIERACLEDIAFRVIAATVGPITPRSRVFASATRQHWPDCSARSWRCVRRRGWPASRCSPWTGRRSTPTRLSAPRATTS